MTQVSTRGHDHMVRQIQEKWKSVPTKLFPPDCRLVHWTPFLVHLVLPRLLVDSEIPVPAPAVLATLIAAAVIPKRTPPKAPWEQLLFLPQTFEVFLQQTINERPNAGDRARYSSDDSFVAIGIYPCASPEGHTLTTIVGSRSVHTHRDRERRQRIGIDIRLSATSSG